MSESASSPKETPPSSPAASAPIQEITKEYHYPERDPSSTPAPIKLYKGLDDTLITLTTKLIVPVLAVAGGVYVYTGGMSFDEMYGILYARTHTLVQGHSEYAPDYLIAAAFFFLLSCVLLLRSVFFGKRKEPVYLIDFATWSPPKHWEISIDWFQERINMPDRFTPENIDFQQKIGARSGLGNRTVWPLSQHPKDSTYSMKGGREETLMAFSDCIDELLTKTGLKAQQIDVLVVNCGLFNPTPSLASMMINKFKMRSDITSYNLGAMGCSAGAISIDLARELLQNHKNAFAIVLSTETIATNLYLGNMREKLVSNCIFRCGAAGVLLTNKQGINAKYELDHTVRICTAANDDSYKAIYESEDEKGLRGASLVSSKYLVPVVSDALKRNLAILGPKVLPYSEQVKYLFNTLARSMLGKEKVNAYIPNFKKAFKYFCIHAGGKAIIDGMQKNLDLSDRDVEPSRATLYRYGNTSSSSIWYELYYIEKVFGVKKGDKIWQLAFGAGIKCNSCVWRALKNIPKE